jgi:two-component system sensor histidine kinase/response regulator
MLTKRIFVTLFVLQTVFSAHAQGDAISTLLQRLKSAPHDTIRVNLYYSISKRYWGRDFDSVLLMAGRGAALADSIHFKKGKALNCLSMGVAWSNKGNYPEALNYYFETLKLSEELHLEGLSGNTYTNIAIIYSSHGDKRNAIDFFQKALHISEKYGRAATCGPLINLSDLYTDLGQYEIASNYAHRALRISQDESDSSNLAIALFNISTIHKRTNQMDSAQWYLQTSIEISTRIQDYAGVSYCLNSLSEIMIGRKNYHQGLALAEKSLINLRRVDDDDLLMNVYHLLYQCYVGIGNADRALHYRNEEIKIKEKLYDMEKERQANDLINQYNLERKEFQIQLLEKDIKLQQKEIARSSLLRTVYGGGAIVLTLLVIYLAVSNSRWRAYNRIMLERNAVIQEQKETITQQKANVERLNAVKDRIISIISHDFRSPINTLRGFIQLLKFDALTKEQTSHTLEQIDKNLSATLEMTDDLLTWGGAQMAGLKIEKNVFDIGELVKENIQLVHPRSDSKGVSIVNAITHPTTVCGDRNMINIVLRNLITNAIKFSNTSGTIVISAWYSDRETVVSIMDSGVGIPADRLKTLFDGSLNATTTGTANEKGTGIGLLLCYELTKDNGGKIWAESKLNQGSTFYFSLPTSAH